MKIQTRTLPLLAILAGAIALAACGKKPEETPAPMTPPAAAPTTPPMSTPPEETPPAGSAMNSPAPTAEPVAVASVDLGTAVGADQKVTSSATEFAPKDTIYAVVSTTGAAPNAKISAKWTFQDGQVVNEASQTIAPNGPATTAFHIAKADGWPAGNYKVEIMLDDKPATSKDFSVK